MHQLPSEYSFLPFDPDDHRELFEDVEWMARDEGTGADAMNEDEYLIAVIKHPTRKIAGAVWADRRDDSFSFHMAVHRDHQGRGLSHVLIEQGMQEFEKIKQSNPDMPLRMTVIDPRMAAALYQHGFIAVDDWADESFSFVYSMTPIDSPSSIILEAHGNDNSLFLDAIATGAKLSGLPDEEVALRLKAWSDAPCGSQPLDLPVHAATELLGKLPLAQCHLDFLSAQHRVSTPNVPRPAREAVYREYEPVKSAPVTFRPKR